MGMHQMLGPISGSADPDPIDVTRSLRFTDGDSAYLSRTPSSAGNLKTWTWSAWLKRAEDTAGSTNQSLWSIRNGSPNQQLFRIESTNKLRIYLEVGSSIKYDLTTSQVFQDFSAWYHIVLAFDSTQSTASDRVKVYLNGTQITSFSSATYPSLNQDGVINTNGARHDIGQGGNNNDYLDGYLANVQFIDGEALQPSKFGVLNDDNVWVPAQYSGSYGTNGYYLQFNSTTTSALGDDTSGNNNDFTPTNLSGTDVKLFVDKKPDGSNWGNISNAFDGNTSTYADGTYLNGTTSTITFNPPITGVTSLRVYWYGTSNYGYNGSNVGTGSTTAEYKSVYSGSAITVNSIQGTSQPGNGVIRLYAIEVNGSVLTGYSRGTPTVIDSVFDSPTNGSQTDTGAGGEVSGNYATLNPLDSALSLSNGNLDFSKGSAADWKVARSTIFLSSGKWYWEVNVEEYNSGSQPIILGIARPNGKLAGTDTEITSGGTIEGYEKNGQKRVNGSLSSYGASYTNGDVISFALDLDAGTLVAYKNNSSQGTLLSSITTPVCPVVALYTGGTQMGTGPLTINFGSKPFTYSAPSNYKSICTTNLPTPSIAEGADYFDTVLYTGTGAAKTISGLNFGPDMAWIKERNDTNWHRIIDIVRGQKEIFPNATNVESSFTQGLNSFTSDGFTLGTGADSNVNTNNNTYVAWAWDGGSSTVSNTNGSITSSVRANASAGFSIVGYTGNGSQNATVGHGLNAEPELLIIKNRSSAQQWDVYHKQVGYGKVLRINSTAATATASDVFPSSNTSSVFKLGSSSSQNGNGNNMIAYCFAPVAGYSAFGSYTGNGSTNGPFIFTGFRVAFLMTKRTDSSTSGDWNMVDTTRGTINSVGPYLYANKANAEGNVTIYDLLSNGFKIRESGAGTNANNSSYIYMAWAEHPFKTARAR